MECGFGRLLQGLTQTHGNIAGRYRSFIVPDQDSDENVKHDLQGPLNHLANLDPCRPDPSGETPCWNGEGPCEMQLNTGHRVEAKCTAHRLRI